MRRPIVSLCSSFGAPLAYLFIEKSFGSSLIKEALKPIADWEAMLLLGIIPPSWCGLN